MCKKKTNYRARNTIKREIRKWISSKRINEHIWIQNKEKYL